MRAGRFGVTIAAAAVIAVSLSGCAGLVLIPLAAGAGAGQSASQGAKVGSGPGDDPGSGATSAPSGSGIPDDQFDATGRLIPFGDGAVSSRGLVIKQSGDAAGVISADGTEHVLAFRVGAFALDASCLLPQATPPNGEHFLTVTIDGRLAPDLEANGGPAQIDFGAANWAYFASQSSDPVRVGSGDAACRGDSLPTLVYVPGERFSLMEVLVVPAAHGTIAFAADGAGWEWQY